MKLDPIHFYDFHSYVLVDNDPILLLVLDELHGFKLSSILEPTAQLFSVVLTEEVKAALCKEPLCFDEIGSHTLL